VIAGRSASAQARMLTSLFYRRRLISPEMLDPRLSGTEVPDRPEWIHEIIG
jgi:hypothetical protein